jgi:type VI secretion system protein ImpF
MFLEKNKEIQPSILDRLIDKDPHNKIDIRMTNSQYLRDLKISVRRDLINLLNTRYRMKSPPEHYKNLEKSLVDYGLPDLATVNVVNIEKKRIFVKKLEEILSKYEPRFKSVKVKYIENKDKDDRSLRFRIDAMLYADPAPEIIVFDSVLDPVDRKVTVEESNYV